MKVNGMDSTFVIPDDVIIIMSMLQCKVRKKERRDVSDERVTSVITLIHHR